MTYPVESAPELVLTAIGDCGRDVYWQPRAGDMFRLGALWAIVEQVSPTDAVLRLIDPLLGGHKMVSVALPLPDRLVPVSESPASDH